MKTVEAIQTYFSAEPHGRKVQISEFKELTAEDRRELAELACKELGVEYTP